MNDSNASFVPTDWTAERRGIVRLARTEGLGPIKLRRLLDAFGSASAVLAASRRDLTETPGIGPKLAGAILDPTADAAVEETITQFIGAGVRVLFEDDDEYPPALREIYDNPVFLTVRGMMAPRDRLALAIVGSRRCTRYGVDQAARFAHALAARGITIVSGLARGIDRAAHGAALAAGGRTIAVLASGLGNIYPPEHEELAERVCEAGAIVSEAPIDGPPLAGLFPQRNRVISGMSLGVLVVEAAERSGALSTAHHAAEQNRDVFCIPGRLSDPASQGTNRLIQKGATLVMTPEDLLDRLGPVEWPAAVGDAESAPSPTEDEAPPPGLGDLEARLWQMLGPDELAVDLMAERLELEPSTVSATLLTMELRRLVDRLPGSLFRRRTVR